MSDFASVIRKHGKYVGPPAGPSMRPLLRPYRDAAVLVAPTVPLKKYDVILYRRDSGQYVLHRIIRADARGYVLCGDAIWRKEYGITDAHVIGVMEGFFRDEKYVSCNKFSYQLYSRVVCALRPLRAVWFYVKDFSKSFVRKLRKS